MLYSFSDAFSSTEQLSTTKNMFFPHAFLINFKSFLKISKNVSLLKHPQVN